MKKNYMIDGYNVLYKYYDLNSMSSRARISRQTLEHARTTLEQALKGSLSILTSRITLVYDGAGDRSFQKNGKLDIIFSETGLTADNLIKELIDNKANRQVIVVSSDLSVQDYAKLSGVETMTAEEFLSVVGIGHKQPPIEQKTHLKDKPLTEKEVSEWKKIFE